MSFLAADRLPPQEPSSGVMTAKTLFQTNSGYDDRLAMAVDGVIVHMHELPAELMVEAISSWREFGFATGRMFFSNSDARRVYTTGLWDGHRHEEEIERHRDGRLCEFRGERPYMLSTEGWTRYLESVARDSVRAGAQAIFPEEPIGIVSAGYEPAIAPLWEARYGQKLNPETAEPRTGRTGRLKAELLTRMIGRIARAVKEEAASIGRAVPVILPVHSLYSTAGGGGGMVAPLGMSLTIPDIDGYIGQVWTGPINWTLSEYESDSGTFFGSAWALYDYFVQLARGTNRKLWLLVDPVEDNLDHTWDSYLQWYLESSVAMLLQREVESYEIMPWPDRIFLPGHVTGGGTPGPESFRMIVLSISQALQDVAAGGEWLLAGTEGIGVAVADSLMWAGNMKRAVGCTYGLLLPLAQRGVPVSSCILERSADAAYMDGFRVLLLSYDAMVPPAPETHLSLAEWVRRGGVLVLLGGDGAADYKGLSPTGETGPMSHLLTTLGLNSETAEGDYPLGDGWVMRRMSSPTSFALEETAASEYLPLVDQAVRKAGIAEGLSTPGGFCMRRGPFVIARALQTPVELDGPLVDLASADLPILDQVTLAPGTGGLYRTADAGAGDAHSLDPTVIHATHRLMEQHWDGAALCFTLRGPAETPAAARVAWPAKRIPSVEARTIADGTIVRVDCRADGSSLLIRFDNQPRGVVVKIRTKDATP